MNFNNTKKLANYNNRTYDYCRKAFEIRNNRGACNDTEHCSLDPEWQQIVNKKSMQGGKGRRIKETKQQHETSFQLKKVSACAEKGLLMNFNKV